MSKTFREFRAAFGGIFLAFIAIFYNFEKPPLLIKLIVYISPVLFIISWICIFVTEKFELLKKRIDEYEKKCSDLENENKKLAQNNKGLKEMLSSYKKENRGLIRENQQTQYNLQVYLDLYSYFISNSSDNEIKKAEIIRDSKRIILEKNRTEYINGDD